MSRTKRDILNTERMMERLAELLHKHRQHKRGTLGAPMNARMDAEALRRISMTLRRWHELECGTDTGCILRGKLGPVGGFVHEENGKPFLYVDKGGASGRWYFSHPDYEKGARKRLAKIMTRYPALSAYVQTDPRGCALYILKPGDVPDGADVSAYYSRGLAVHQ